MKFLGTLTIFFLVLTRIAGSHNKPARTLNFQQQLNVNLLFGKLLTPWVGYNNVMGIIAAPVTGNKNHMYLDNG